MLLPRSKKIKRIVGALYGERCVGYIVFSSKFGRVAQIAVDKEFTGIAVSERPLSSNAGRDGGRIFDAGHQY